jgi:hypothetical protein
MHICKHLTQDEKIGWAIFYALNSHFLQMLAEI